MAGCPQNPSACCSGCGVCNGGGATSANAPMQALVGLLPMQQNGPGLGRRSAVSVLTKPTCHLSLGQGSVLGMPMALISPGSGSICRGLVLALSSLSVLDSEAAGSMLPGIRVFSQGLPITLLSELLYLESCRRGIAFEFASGIPPQHGVALSCQLAQSRTYLLPVFISISISSLP